MEDRIAGAVAQLHDRFLGRLRARGERLQNLHLDAPRTGQAATR